MSRIAHLALAPESPGTCLGVRRIQTRSHFGKFLKGPVDWKWLSAAGRLPGRALHVAVAIAFLNGFEAKGTVRLRPSVCTELGIKRHSAYRALAYLEQAGLIKVDRKKGAAPLVTVLFPIAVPERDAA